MYEGRAAAVDVRRCHAGVFAKAGLLLLMSVDAMRAYLQRPG
jgi:hypothetical protein